LFWLRCAWVFSFQSAGRLLQDEVICTTSELYD
jgi:hypothetical protein